MDDRGAADFRIAAGSAVGEPPGVVDPKAVFGLSLMFPGAGFFLLGRPGVAIGIGAVTLWLGCGTRGAGLVAALAVHVGAALAARRAAAELVARDTIGERVRDIRSRVQEQYDDDPETAAPDRRASDDTSGGQLRPNSPLDADAFLAELRRAWNARKSGEIGDDGFAGWKASLTARIVIPDADEGRALMAAVTELRDAKIVTAAERDAIRAAAQRWRA